MDSNRYSRFRAEFHNNNIPWGGRIPVAIWRGATTGQPMDPTLGWRSLPRIRLCEIARANPTTIDAGITKVGQINDPSANDWLQSRDLMREFVPAGEFQRYRYQIDIDGNTNSWPGLFIKLLSGSPVLKVASPGGYRQWVLYDRLVPWINYIPVDTDMGDLAGKIEWLRAHDEIARRIGESGRELADMLSDEQEISRTAPVIAAAIRTTGSEPLTEMSFAADAANHEVLRSGWHAPDADGVSAAGFEARLELRKPVDVGDLLLILDLAPILPPQRVTIVANGEILVERSLSERTAVYCPLPRRIAYASETLGLSLFFPDSPDQCIAGHSARRSKVWCQTAQSGGDGRAFSRWRTPSGSLRMR